MNARSILYSLVPLALLLPLAPRAGASPAAPGAQEGELAPFTYTVFDDDGGDWLDEEVQEPAREEGRGYLGISIGSDDEPGVRVDEVRPGTAAARAGLCDGDRVLSMDGTAVGDLEQFVEMVRERAPGDRVELEVRRGDETLRMTAELGVRVEEPLQRVDESPRAREEQGQLREDVADLLHDAEERASAWMERLHDHARDLHEHLRDGTEDLHDRLRELHERHPDTDVRDLHELFRRGEDRRREQVQRFVEQMEQLQHAGRREVEQWLELRRSDRARQAGPGSGPGAGAWYRAEDGSLWWSPGPQGARPWSRSFNPPDASWSGPRIGAEPWSSAPPAGDEVGRLKDEIGALRDQIGELRDALRELRESRR